MNYQISFHNDNNILITVHEKYKNPIIVHENTPYWASYLQIIITALLLAKSSKVTDTLIHTQRKPQTHDYQ